MIAATWLPMASHFSEDRSLARTATFMTADDLRSWIPRVNVNFSGVLQQFVYPQGVHNSLIRTVSLDGITSVSWKVNRHLLANDSTPLFQRCGTFEAWEGLSSVKYAFKSVFQPEMQDRIIEVSQPIFQRTVQDCIKDIHFLGNDQHLGLHFKVGSDAFLYFIYASILSEKEVKQQTAAYLLCQQTRIGSDPLKHMNMLVASQTPRDGCLDSSDEPPQRHGKYSEDLRNSYRAHVYSPPPSSKSALTTASTDATESQLSTALQQKEVNAMDQTRTQRSKERVNRLQARRDTLYQVRRMQRLRARRSQRTSTRRLFLSQSEGLGRVGRLKKRGCRKSQTEGTNGSRTLAPVETEQVDDEETSEISDSDSSSSENENTSNGTASRVISLESDRKDDDIRHRDQYVKASATARTVSTCGQTEQAAITHKEISKGVSVLPRVAFLSLKRRETQQRRDYHVSRGVAACRVLHKGNETHHEEGISEKNVKQNPPEFTETEREVTRQSASEGRDRHRNGRRLPSSARLYTRNSGFGVARLPSRACFPSLSTAPPSVPNPALNSYQSLSQATNPSAHDHSRIPASTASMAALDSLSSHSVFNQCLKTFCASAPTAAVSTSLDPGCVYSKMNGNTYTGSHTSRSHISNSSSQDPDVCPWSAETSLLPGGCVDAPIGNASAKSDRTSIWDNRQPASSTGSTRKRRVLHSIYLPCNHVRSVCDSAVYPPSVPTERSRHSQKRSSGGQLTDTDGPLPFSFLRKGHSWMPAGAGGSTLPNAIVVSQCDVDSVINQKRSLYSHISSPRASTRRRRSWSPPGVRRSVDQTPLSPITQDVECLGNPTLVMPGDNRKEAQHWNEPRRAGSISTDPLTDPVTSTCRSEHASHKTTDKTCRWSPSLSIINHHHVLPQLKHITSYSASSQLSGSLRLPLRRLPPLAGDDINRRGGSLPPLKPSAEGSSMSRTCRRFGKSTTAAIKKRRPRRIKVSMRASAGAKLQTAAVDGSRQTELQTTRTPYLTAGEYDRLQCVIPSNHTSELLLDIHRTAAKVHYGSPQPHDMDGRCGYEVLDELDAGL
eukprot:GHVQ01002205.1.p1 GENE.GHVQ01002205.1~~GHVQ01002205.1.p1  ORF type:complete len:1062 (+),score=107.31 GHVQ01002205.1:1392-4577(+)